MVNKTESLRHAINDQHAPDVQNATSAHGSSILLVRGKLVCGNTPRGQVPCSAWMSTQRVTQRAKA